MFNWGTLALFYMKHFQKYVSAHDSLLLADENITIMVCRVVSIARWCPLFTNLLRELKKSKTKSNVGGEKQTQYSTQVLPNKAAHNLGLFVGIFEAQLCVRFLPENNALCFYWVEQPECRVTYLKNEKTQFKVALKKFLNAHSFYSVDELFTCTDDMYCWLHDCVNVPYTVIFLFFVCLWHVPHLIVLWLSRIYGMYICMYVCMRAMIASFVICRQEG